MSPVAPDGCFGGGPQKLFGKGESLARTAWQVIGGTICLSLSIAACLQPIRSSHMNYDVLGERYQQSMLVYQILSTASRETTFHQQKAFSAFFFQFWYYTDTKAASVLTCEEPPLLFSSHFFVTMLNYSGLATSTEFSSWQDGFVRSRDWVISQT